MFRVQDHHVNVFKRLGRFFFNFPYSLKDMTTSVVDNNITIHCDVIFEVIA